MGLRTIGPLTRSQRRKSGGLIGECFATRRGADEAKLLSLFCRIPDRGRRRSPYWLPALRGGRFAALRLALYLDVQPIQVTESPCRKSLSGSRPATLLTKQYCLAEINLSVASLSAIILASFPLEFCIIAHAQECELNCGVLSGTWNQHEKEQRASRCPGTPSGSHC
jgi:hypothetical protein